MLHPLTSDMRMARTKRTMPAWINKVCARGWGTKTIGVMGYLNKAFMNNIREPGTNGMLLFTTDPIRGDI